LILFGGLAVISVTVMWYVYRRRDQRKARDRGEESAGTQVPDATEIQKL
jgi:membrane protein implicated in regulation of membrane protease activity